jgi:acyl carrier protein
MSTQEIYRKVSATLVETLNVDVDEIRPGATLQGDLGVESLDFFDIVFRLESEFGIRIPDDELFPKSLLRGNSDFVQNGKVTDKGLNELRQRIPFADLRAFEKDPDFSRIGDLLTVDLVTRYVRGKLKG